MNIYLAEKLKSLRQEKNVSQEKLAQYLNVSFQAVSKWENANAYPDISLLPDIARYFGVTVDELLQVEKINEKKLYNEYARKTEELYRNGKIAESLELWREAYKEMPNNVKVKEMLMSGYYDADKVKYYKEIVELGTGIYNSDAGMYYKGQALEELTITYAVNGNEEMADTWASKSFQMMHSQEFLYTGFVHGDELLEYFRFTNYWYFNKLFYMACRIAEDEKLSNDNRYSQDVFKAVTRLYEAIYPNDDMQFEDLQKLCTIHRCIAEDEAGTQKDEAIIQKHLNRALECVVKSASVKDHCLTHPLLKGWQVADAPSDNKQIVRMLKDELAWKCFDEYRCRDWFVYIENSLEHLLKE